MAEKIRVINQSTGQPIEFEPVDKVEIRRGSPVNPAEPFHPYANPIDESKARVAVVDIVPAERTTEAMRRAREVEKKAEK